MTPAQNTLILRRNADLVEEWQVFDVDTATARNLTGYTSFALQLRLYGAQPGSAVLSLAQVATAIQGVQPIELLAGIVGIRVGQAATQTAYDALSAGSEAGSEVSLVFDLRATAPGGVREILVEGPVIIKPGVTI